MQHFFSVFGGTLTTVVLPALATALATLAIGYVQKKAAQAGIELSQAQTDLLKTTVTHAVQAVEEKASRAATAGRPMTSEEKRSTALALVAASPTIVPGDIQRMIDTVLPEVRAKLASAG